MGSTLSPAVANLFMQKLEQQALKTTEFKPKAWFRYVDDTFVVWGHGMAKLNNVLSHINSIHPSIQFTM